MYLYKAPEQRIYLALNKFQIQSISQEKEPIVQKGQETQQMGDTQPLVNTDVQNNEVQEEGDDDAEPFADLDTFPLLGSFAVPFAFLSARGTTSSETVASTRVDARASSSDAVETE